MRKESKKKKKIEKKKIHHMNFHRFESVWGAFASPHAVTVHCMWSNDWCSVKITKFAYVSLYASAFTCHWCALFFFPIFSFIFFHFYFISSDHFSIQFFFSCFSLQSYIPFCAFFFHHHITCPQWSWSPIVVHFCSIVARCSHISFCHLFFSISLLLGTFFIFHFYFYFALLTLVKSWQNCKKKTRKSGTYHNANNSKWLLLSIRKWKMPKMNNHNNDDKKKKKSWKKVGKKI